MGTQDLDQTYVKRQRQIPGMYSHYTQVGAYRAHLHHMTSCNDCHSTDVTIPVHQFMAKFEMSHLYTHYKYTRKDKNRLVVSCKWANT